MKVGTILLDPFDRYVDKDGKLPVRPYFDKALLKAICSKGTVSLLGFDLLPNSITSICQVDAYREDVMITIPELNEADILLVSRSDTVCEGGKKFRLHGFKKYGDGNPELYIKI
jgi:hypothetical protein